MHAKNNNRTLWITLLVATLGLTLPAAMASAQAMHPPIQQLIAAQTTSIVCWVEPDNGNEVCSDYAGKINAANNLNLGTTTDGSVTVRPGPTASTSLLHIVLHTMNALTWGFQPAPKGLVFGHTASQVFNGADAALGDSLFTLDLVNNVPPGGPLPNIYQFVFFPQPGQVLKTLAFVVTADGTLRASFGVPDGTPGMAHTTQRGLFSIPGKGIPADAFPTEKVIFRETGQ